jgi:NADPH:quinone reductase
MDKAVRLRSPGGTDRLEVIDWRAQEPGPNEIRIRHQAIGVSFIDIYHRTGLYPLPPPAIPGVEGAGIVEALGDDVEGLAVGQRVAYGGLTGAYATTRLLPAWRAIPLPDAIPFRLAAASTLRGLTAHMLLTRTYPVARGSVLLVHAAAGGLGVILTRWAKHLGATVIATVGAPEKAEVARANRADHVIVGREIDVAAKVAVLTGGRGVDFAIDGIGGGMLARTLACVRRFGTVASIGQAAGAIPPIPVEDIGPMRSLSFARPSVMAYSADKDVYPAAAAAVLGMIEAGISAEIGPDYPLEAAAEAHADLEAGRIIGSAILLP